MAAAEVGNRQQAEAVHPAAGEHKWHGRGAGPAVGTITSRLLNREVGHTKSLVPVYKYLLVGSVCFSEAGSECIFGRLQEGAVFVVISFNQYE